MSACSSLHSVASHARRYLQLTAITLYNIRVVHSSTTYLSRFLRHSQCWCTGCFCQAEAFVHSPCVCVCIVLLLLLLFLLLKLHLNVTGPGVLLFARLIQAYEREFKSPTIQPLREQVQADCEIKACTTTRTPRGKHSAGLKNLLAPLNLDCS